MFKKRFHLLEKLQFYTKELKLLHIQLFRYISNLSWRKLRKMRLKKSAKIWFYFSTLILFSCNWYEAKRVNATKRSKRSLRYRQDEEEDSDGVGGQEKTKRKGMRWKEKCVTSSGEEKDAASIHRSHQTIPLPGRRHFILDVSGRENEFSSVINIIAFPFAATDDRAK